MNEHIPLSTLLERSEEFEAAVRALFPEAGIHLAVSTPQHELAATACTIAIEHALVLRSAFACIAPNTGAALLRLQYEAVLRATWLIFAATPTQVDKLARSLDLEAEQDAKKLPGYMDMLASVVRQAPNGLSAPLAEFNQYSRHALNSFVHTGIHPLTRARTGFPETMALELTKFSNALMHFAYRLLASLTGSQRRMDRVTHVYTAFQDCVPMTPGVR